MSLKKIIMYIDMMGHGGAQRVMANLAEYFTRQGVRIVLVNDFELSKDEPQYCLTLSIERKYLKNSIHGNPVKKNIERILLLRKLIKEENPDIVLSFLGRPNLRMLIATIGLKTKKVVSVRNDPNREYAPNGLKKKITQLLFRFADGCVFQTAEAAEYFSNAVSSKSEIIINPVGDQFYNVSWRDDGKSIITVGRLEKQKNQRMLIEAFSRIASQFDDVNLYIYGTGSLKEELDLQIKELGMEKRVFLAGDTNDVPSILSTCMLFVLPSDFEGMPNTLLEAMAVGVPCISTDCPSGGPREIIQNGQNGFLVKCGDGTDLSKIMMNCLSDSDIRAGVGNNAKKTAERFRSSVVYGQWSEYLQRIAK